MLHPLLPHFSDRLSASAGTLTILEPSWQMRDMDGLILQILRFAQRYLLFN